jgi:hypothetical protein
MVERLDVASRVVMLNCALECNVASASTLAVVKIGASKTEVRLLVAMPVFLLISGVHFNFGLTVFVRAGH